MGYKLGSIAGIGRECKFPCNGEGDLLFLWRFKLKEGAMSGICYGVVAMTFPWTFEMRQQVGYYGNKELAERVAGLVKAMNRNDHRGGVNVFVEECPSGGVLVDRVTVALDFEELAYLAALRFRHGEDCFGMEP